MSTPNLRFKEFSGSWKPQRIGDIGENIIGLTYSPRNVTADPSSPIVLRSSNVQEDQLVLEDIVRVDSRINEKLYVQANDILICTRNGSKRLIGKNILLPKLDKPATFGAFMSVFRSPINDFISQLFNTRSFNEQIQVNLGATINQLTTKNLNDFRFNFPARDEQIKICTFLSAIDQKKTLLTNYHNLLITYKKGLVQKLFNGDIRFKNLEGRPFPEPNIFLIGTVLRKNSAKNKRQECKLVESVSNHYGFINQNELFEGRVIASKDTSNYYIIKKSCFAYNPSRIDVGSLAYKRDENTSIISPLYVSFYAKQEFVNDVFLLNWFASQEFQSQMKGAFEGSVRNTLSYESLSKMTISLPCLEEQIKIASFLSAIDEKISNVQKQLELTKQYKQGLLQQMFV